jgi:DNA-binding IclR family transcriptional regulator
MATGADATGLIRSVQRACALLDAFTRASPRLTLAELAERTKLPKPTTYRLAATLIECGLMTQHPDGRYGLGVRMIDIGSIARSDLDLIEVCGPVMERLAEWSGETVLLGLVDWDPLEITIVHRIDSAHELSVVSRVGNRTRLVLGALGKALLQGLDPAEVEGVVARMDLSAHTDHSITDPAHAVAEVARCRELGFATDRDEFLAGVAAVSVPVAFGGTRPVAAIGVVGPASRIDQRLELVGERMRHEMSHLTERN